MSTLLLHLEGTMQSWATQASHRSRETDKDPSKSAVIGLMANALGLDLDDSIEDLARLKMMVRVDRPGQIQTVLTTPKVEATASSVIDEYEVNGNFYKSCGEKLKSADRLLVRKSYLIGAYFLVGFEGDGNILNKIQDALIFPSRPLFLGRKNCLLSRPIFDPSGVMNDPLIDRMKSTPLAYKSNKSNIRFLIESSSGSYRQDVPVGTLRSRKFSSRIVASVPFSSL